MPEIETRDITTAQESVRALRRSDPTWLPPGYYESPWIFRGQRKAECGLVPSAWLSDSEKEKDRHLLVAIWSVRIYQDGGDAFPKWEV